VHIGGNLAFCTEDHEGRPRPGIEAFYNPVRRHTFIGDLSPAEFEALHSAAQDAA